MGSPILAAGLGVVSGGFLIVILGELFYLLYWRKRPLANPRVNNIGHEVAYSDGELETEREVVRDIAIDVSHLEVGYQCATLHSELVEKLFPSMGVSIESDYNHLLGHSRMLFTIKEETLEELEGMDGEGHGKGRGTCRSARSKSWGDVPFSPDAHYISPADTPFLTPMSSPGPPSLSPLRIPRQPSSTSTLSKSPRGNVPEILMPSITPPASPRRKYSAVTPPSSPKKLNAAVAMATSPHKRNMGMDIVILAPPSSPRKENNNGFFSISPTRAQCGPFTPRRERSFDSGSDDCITPSPTPPSSPGTPPTPFLTPAFGACESPDTSLMSVVCNVSKPASHTPPRNQGTPFTDVKSVAGPQFRVLQSPTSGCVESAPRHTSTKDGTACTPPASPGKVSTPYFTPVFAPTMSPAEAFLVTQISATREEKSIHFTFKP